MRQVLGEVLRFYAEAWRLRVSFVKSHLVFNILLAAVFTPLMAFTIFLALKLSGQPALADFDIALFLLSPVGFAAGLVMAGMALVLLVLDVSLMMAVSMRARQGQSSGLWAGIAIVTPRLPAVFRLAVQLALRLLLIALPFLLLAGAAYGLWLTEYDINYYLSQKPPEFGQAVAVIGAAVGAMLIVALWRSLGWVLALPLVLFEGLTPGDAISTSRQKMQGQKLGFLMRLAVWALIGAVVTLATLTVVGFVLQMGLSLVGSSLRLVALFLLFSTALWAALNLFLTAITTGALSIAFMESAGWPTVETVGTGSIPRRVLVAALGGAVVASLVGGIGVAGAVAVDQTRPVAVIAHRGAAGARPENTMVSVKKAIEDKADWVEIDVQETADGQVVVIHDSDFMKVAGNPTKIWDVSFEELAEIDIGSWFDPVFSDQRTPLLKDVLLEAKDKAGVIIELKYYGHDQDLEARVAQIVEDTGMVEQVKIMSLKYGAVQKMHGLRPDWTVGLLASASLGNMWNLDADFLAVNTATVSSKFVRSSQQTGKPVYVWTVNDALSMSAMLSFGVDGLITDEPALARQVLADRRDISGVERLILGLAGRIGLNLPGRSDEDG